MVAQKGKDLLLKLDSDGLGTFVTVAGLRSRRIAFNSETVARVPCCPNTSIKLQFTEVQVIIRHPVRTRKIRIMAWKRSRSTICSCRTLAD